MDVTKSEYGLSGKRAVVCGSTQGMGKACAMRFARLGAEVILVARDEAALGRVCGELDTGGGQQHTFVCADFNEPPTVEDKVARHLEKTGSAQILLNNTGGPKSGPILDAAPEEFVEAFRRHVVCNQLLTRTLLPGMKTAGYGRVINIISISVREPIPGLGVSNTTRWAVASWAKTMAGELAPFGITVNNVLPGYTDTARLTELIEAISAKRGIPTDAVTQEMVAAVPAGRLASADEIASAAAFLASPAAAFVTGINLPVDGGRLSSM